MAIANNGIVNKQNGGYIVTRFTGPGYILKNHPTFHIGANSAGEVVESFNIISIDWSIGNNAYWTIQFGANTVCNLTEGQHYYDLSDGKNLLLPSESQTGITVTKNGQGPGTLIMKIRKNLSDDDMETMEYNDFLSAANSSGTPVIYDPSDLTSLYQSRTGGSTGAVDAVVGIMLDKAQMGNKTAAAFISEQSNFNDDGAATAVGESEILGGGVYRIYSSAGSTSYIHWGDTLTVGAFYEVKFTIDSIAVPGSGIRVQDSGEVFTTTGAKTTILLADNQKLFVKRNPALACDYQISNVQVRAIPGSHALAPSDAARPILRSSGGLYYLDADGTDDWMQVLPTKDLGEQWWHVGGWQADATGKFAFGTSDSGLGGIYAAISGGNGSWQIRNAADSGYSSLTATSSQIDDAHVLTLEQASTASMSGRINGGGAGSTTDIYDDSGATQGLALLNRRNSTYSLGLDGRFYGGVWNAGTLSSANRSIIERWVASKAGVSL